MSTFIQPASCVECRLCNINGPLHCSDCESEKRFGLCPDEPLQIEVTLQGRAAVASVQHYTVTDDGRLLPIEDEADRPRKRTHKGPGAGYGPVLQGG